ncbi:MAG: nuclease-related domain-containing protein [Wenzhouxiangellaceae bacterium]
MKKPTRSPLNDPPVRTPGQSIEEQRHKLLDDRVVTPFLAAGVFGTIAMQEWLREFSPRPPMPWLFTALFVATAGFFVYRFFRTRRTLRRLKLARDGERAVGQYLERLHADGYEVFHDIIGEGFNLDHVLIGPAGVFTIETKSYSKPASGPAEITFDGEQVAIGGWQPDRNPIIQARAQAGWLRALLRETTGRDFSIMPVIVYPGWFIKQNGRPKPPLWVLNPKALPQFLKHKEQVLGESDIKLAAYHLSRFIRAQERESIKK